MPTLHIDLETGSTQAVPLSGELVERFNGDWDELYSELSPTLRLIIGDEVDVANFWLEFEPRTPGFGTGDLCEEHPDFPGWCAYHRAHHQRTLDQIAADPRCPTHGYAHGYDCQPPRPEPAE